MDLNLRMMDRSKRPVPVFYARFDDHDNPLKQFKGTGVISIFRSTIGTYVHPTTRYVTDAAVDTLRIEAAGALVEQIKTNRILRSRDFSHAAWVDGGSPMIAQSEIGIDGVANKAWSIFDNSSSVQENKSQGIAIADDDTQWNASIYVGKTGDGEDWFPLIQFSLIGGGTELLEGRLINAKTGATNSVEGGDGDVWIEEVGDFWRVCISLTNNSTGNTTAKLLFAPAGGITIDALSNSAQGAAKFDGAQIESGNCVTSFIETVASTVQRTRDILTFPRPGNIDMTVGSAFARYTPRNKDSQVLILGSSFNYRNNILFDSNNNLCSFDGSNDNTLIEHELVRGVTIKVGNKWSGSTMTGVLNGQIGDAKPFDGSFDLGPTMRIGASSTNSYHANGNISDIKIYGTELSDAMMQAMTA